jgi:hypothetical protein
MVPSQYETVKQGMLAYKSGKNWIVMGHPGTSSGKSTCTVLYFDADVVSFPGQYSDKY